MNCVYVSSIAMVTKVLISIHNFGSKVCLGTFKQPSSKLRLYDDVKGNGLTDNYGVIAPNPLQTRVSDRYLLSVILLYMYLVLTSSLNSFKKRFGILQEKSQNNCYAVITYPAAETFIHYHVSCKKTTRCKHRIRSALSVHTWKLRFE